MEVFPASRSRSLSRTSLKEGTSSTTTTALGKISQGAEITRSIIKTKGSSTGKEGTVVTAATIITITIRMLIIMLLLLIITIIWGRGAATRA